MNRILITGCPRSGTSQFCKIISKNNNINLWSDGHEYQYEPFSTRPSMRFDESDWIQNFLNKNESEFVGFKMFNGDTLSVTETAKRFDMKIIPVLRKDIISVYLSLALLPLQEKNKNNHITFGLDGYKHMGYESYTKDWEKLLSPLADMLHLAKKSGNFPDYIHNIDI